MNCYMATPFSWLHRAIYGREYKCHPPSIENYIKKNSFPLPKLNRTLAVEAKQNKVGYYRNAVWECLTLYHVIFMIASDWTVQIWHRNRTSLRATKYQNRGCAIW